MTDIELPEEHKVTGTNGSKEGVEALLSVALETAQDLPENKRYDVTIEITEVEK